MEDIWRAESMIPAAERPKWRGIVGERLNCAGGSLWSDKEDDVAERKAVVGPEEGLHARPAARFVQAAKQFSAEIVVVKDGREANAKSPLRLMALAAKKGEEISIRASGEDAEEAVETLAALAAADE